MSDTIKITLGGTEYNVPRLTLRQMRALELGVIKVQENRAKAEIEAHSLSDVVDRAYDSNVSIVVAGLSRSHPDITAESIFDMETTNAEVLAAANAILDFAGMGGTPKGEAEAPKKAGE